MQTKTIKIKSIPIKNMKTEYNVEFVLPVIKKFKKLKSYKNVSFKILSIDPGIRKIGWSIIDYETMHVYDIGLIEYKKKDDEYGNDTRIRKIVMDLEYIILKYKPFYVVIEQITFTKGKYSFSENILLKANGFIFSTLLLNDQNIIQITIQRAQSLIFEKSSIKSNKEKIKEYVINFINEKQKQNRIIKNKIFDVTDSIFIGISLIVACNIYNYQN